MLKIVKRSRDSWLDLAGGLRLASCQKLHTCQACQKLKSHASCCTTGQKSQAGQAVCLRLELGTQPSRKVKSPEYPVWEKLTFHIPSHPTIYTYISLYPRYSENFQREFWERNPREKQDWFIHNLHIETLQIPLLSSSPLSKPWKVHYQNLFSPYPYLWEDHLAFGKQLRRNQFHIGWCYGQVAESGKLKKK